ncbi:hypothetical protein BDR05DRAFT_1002273 [Suillus weaverae]|nr:hypothetical protein BDR05DRAFT_1002273 [Suillus weaverae]
MSSSCPVSLHGLNSGIRDACLANAVCQFVRPPNKVRQFLRKVKDGAMKRISHSNLKNLCSRELVFPNVDYEGALSTLNYIEVQDTPPDVKQGANLRSVDVALRDAHDGQNAPTTLDDTDNVEVTYLQPLRIFDTVMGGTTSLPYQNWTNTIPQVHPYAKMALGVLSCASQLFCVQIVLAQADRDKARIRFNNLQRFFQDLTSKLRQVYGFMTQDDMFHLISSMSTVLGQISHQTLACAHFIRDYSEKKIFWKRLGKNVASETDDMIQRYSNVVDALTGNFRDQVACDVATYVHRTSKGFGRVSDSTPVHPSTDEILDLSGMIYAEGAGLDTRKRRLPGTRTDILSKIMG